MTLAEFNALPSAQAESALIDCCGSVRWAASVAARRPYANKEALEKSADSIWWKLEHADWLEAFSHHPQIGDKPASGSDSARQWAEGEQAGARAADRAGTSTVKPNLLMKPKPRYRPGLFVSSYFADVRFGSFTTPSEPNSNRSMSAMPPITTKFHILPK